MKFRFVVLCIIFCSFSSFSQTDPIKDVHITLTSDHSPINLSDSLLLGNFDTMDSLLVDYYDNSTFKVALTVLLSDTSNISKIFVKLGRTEGNGELFNNFFLFDHSNQPHGISLTRNKLFVEMEIGEFTDVSELFYEVSVIRPNSIATKPFKKNLKRN